MPSSEPPIAEFLSKGELGITHFALQVSDLDRSLAFYCGLLQLEERHRLEVEKVGLTEVFLGGPGGGGGLLDLIRVANAEDQIAPPKGVLTHLTIAVPDIADLRKRLADAGVAETMVHDLRGVLIVFVTDPDGYHVELIGQSEPQPT
jgi:lactoylglutathione lyase